MSGQEATHPTDPAGRLDSWKEIAEYLGRSLRTVKRWEQTLGLPVRRLPGAQRHSVFAYRHEIDTWLGSNAGQTGVRPTSDPALRPRLIRYGLPAALLLIVTTFVTWAWSAAPSADAITVTSDERGVIAKSQARTLWEWPYPAVEGGGAPTFERDLGARAAVTAIPGGGWEVTAVTPAREIPATHEWIGSDLVRLASDGREKWRYVPADTFVFGDTTFGKPWHLTAWMPEPGEQRIASAWRHMVRWPSILRILRADAQAPSTFVNPGWILNVAWMRRDAQPLVIAGGISNAFDAGIIAVVDPAAGDASAPPGGPGQFVCENCPSQSPVMYAVFPRSEINLAAGAGFNTAGVTKLANQILVRTQEVPSTPVGAEAVYEFSESFELKHASFSDRYWEIHRQLESEGKLTHSRASCPDRDGPREVRLWTPKEGWRSVTRSSAPPSDPRSPRVSRE